jgi:hypothetical protein
VFFCSFSFVHPVLWLTGLTTEQDMQKGINLKSRSKRLSEKRRSLFFGSGIVGKPKVSVKVATPFFVELDALGLEHLLLEVQRHGHPAR